MRRRSHQLPFDPTDYDGGRSVRQRVALPEPDPEPEPLTLQDRKEREWCGMDRHDNLWRLRVLGRHPGLREHAEVGRWDLVDLGITALMD